MIRGAIFLKKSLKLTTMVIILNLKLNQGNQALTLTLIWFLFRKKAEEANPLQILSRIKRRQYRPTSCQYRQIRAGMGPSLKDQFFEMRSIKTCWLLIKVSSKYLRVTILIHLDNRRVSIFRFNLHQTGSIEFTQIKDHFLINLKKQSMELLQMFKITVLKKWQEVHCQGR